MAILAPLIGIPLILITLVVLLVIGALRGAGGLLSTVVGGSTRHQGCPECGVTFATRHQMLEHLYREHPRH